MYTMTEDGHKICHLSGCLCQPRAQERVDTHSYCMPKNCWPIYIEHSIFSTVCRNSEVINSVENWGMCGFLVLGSDTGNGWTTVHTPHSPMEN